MAITQMTPKEINDFNKTIIADTLQEQITLLKEALKELIPLAEDGHALHKRNGCHQEFLSEDVDRINKARTLLQVNEASEDPYENEGDPY